MGMDVKLRHGSKHRVGVWRVHRHGYCMDTQLIHSSTPAGTRPGSPELGATPGSNAVTQWRPTPTSTPTPAAGPMAPPSGWKAPARGMDGLHAGVPGGAPTLANGFRSYDGQLAGEGG